MEDCYVQHSKFCSGAQVQLQTFVNASDGKFNSISIGSMYFDAKEINTKRILQVKFFVTPSSKRHFLYHFQFLFECKYIVTGLNVASAQLL